MDEQKSNTDRLAEWRRRNDAEMAGFNRKHPGDFYIYSGLVIATLGGAVGFFTELYSLTLAIPLGIIIMGIGDILRRMGNSPNKGT